MDLSLNDEQLALQKNLEEFAQEHLNDDLIERDAHQEFAAGSWKLCADQGVQGLPFPSEYGGRDADAVTVAVALEALGYGCRDSGLLFSINAHMWSCALPLWKFGNDAQRRRYLPGLCDGSLIGVQAMTEPGTGSDAFALTTSARAEGDTYVLNGSKTFITNAPVADLFIVFATTNASTGVGGLCAFLVESDTPGLKVGRAFNKMGIRTSPLGELIFDECAVPAANMLATPGTGMAIFNTAMDWERSFILASALGTMRRQIERSVSYAKTRTQFGQSISSFQAVSHRIVDMRVRLEAGRLMLYNLAWLKSQGRRTTAESAMVKLFLSEAFVETSMDALQTHGGLGYMVEMELERDVRDAMASRIYSGTSDIQRNIIARSMGL